jgi:hypothetical protein
MSVLAWTCRVLQLTSELHSPLATHGWANGQADLHQTTRFLAILVAQGQAGFGNSANTSFIYAGFAVTTTASENALHAIQDVFNGALSTTNVDGTSTGSLNPGSGSLSASTTVATGFYAGNGFTGQANEMGVWATTFSGTNMTNLCHNQFTYWGTATSC